MSAKTITLLIAILSTLGTILGAVAGSLPPEWALLIAAFGSGVYAIVRALQKVKHGAPIKSLFATTEAWGAGLAIVASVATAAAGVIPSYWAPIVATIAGIMLKIARGLQISKTFDVPAGPAAVLLLLLFGAGLAAGCRTGQTPFESVVSDINTIVDCTKSVCAQQPEPVCQQIVNDVLSCVPAIIAGNGAPCLGLVQQQNVQVLVADLYCILDDFAESRANAPQKLGASANAPDARAAVRQYLVKQKVQVRR